MKRLQDLLTPIRRGEARATTAKRYLRQETTSPPTRFLAYTLGVRPWRLGFTTVAALEAERRIRRRTSTQPAVEQGHQFNRRRGIGRKSAWLSVMECVAWRDLRTATQVGSMSGLTPTPPHSGQASRALGITKAGHGSMRAMAIEIAWSWRRFQPDSA